MKNIAIILLAFLVVLSCKKDNANIEPTYNVKINLQHRVGNQAFAAATPYTNAMGEQYKLDRFHYYFTNVVLSQNGIAAEKEKDSYHLIQAENNATCSFTFKTKSNSHNQLQFLIGVDSARNVSGIQSGALDPLNGMFWTWHSGYIMLKAEGTSTASTAHQNMMTYHIGGFSGPHSTLRKITLPLPSALNTAANGTTVINLNVDINKFFSGVHILKIADSAVSMSHGALSAKYADNYATMFSVKNLVQQ